MTGHLSQVPHSLISQNEFMQAIEAAADAAGDDFDTYSESDAAALFGSSSDGSSKARSGRVNL